MARPRAASWWRSRASSIFRFATSASENRSTTCCPSIRKTSWRRFSTKAGMNPYMEEALDLAAQGLGRTSPNPAVGAVVVQEGAVAGRGFHTYAGVKHAEVLALEEAR